MCLGQGALCVFTKFLAKGIIQAFLFSLKNIYFPLKSCLLLFCLAIKIQCRCNIAIFLKESVLSLYCGSRSGILTASFVFLTKYECRLCRAQFVSLQHSPWLAMHAFSALLDDWWHYVISKCWYSSMQEHEISGL